MTGRVADGRPFIFCFQTSQGSATFASTSPTVIRYERIGTVVQ